MKQIHSLILTLLVAFSCLSAMAGDVVYSNPAIIQQSTQNIVVYFNAAEGNKGLMGYTGDVYAHTGVTTQAGAWKHAPTWGDNSAKYKLEKAGDNLWKLTIGTIKDFYGLTATEVPSQLCFVFRSSDNSKEGKGVGGTDMFLDVYPDGDLALNLGTNLSSYVFGDADSNVTVTATTSAAADIKIYLNSVSGTPVKQASGVTSLSWTNNFAVGNHTVYAVATSGGKSVTKSITLCHRGNSAQKNFSGTLKEGAMKNADGSVTFCLYAPLKSNAILVGEWDDFAVKADNVMNYQGDKYFWITVPAGKLDMDKEYGYYFLVDDVYSVADPYAKLILDPWNDKYINDGYTRYPGLKDFPEDKVGAFPIAVFHGNGDGYQWQVSNFEAPSRENLVIYEILVRDFTSEQCLATAMTKLDYLKSLGVNAIELMPVMEFDGNNSWGYNPMFYFAPDKYYGDAATYKRFIDECHSRGMAVILDVVLNHATGNHPWCKMYWDDTAGTPSADSPFFNVEAPHDFSVFNDWKQENDHVQQYFCDMLTYWIKEFKVDGYRFDLVKGLGASSSYGTRRDGGNYNASRVAIMKRYADAIFAANPKAHAIFEAFVSSQEENEYGTYGCMSWRNMNENFCQAAMGFSASSSFTGMFTGNESRVFGSTVGYMESHDEERMAYKQRAYGATAEIKSIINSRMRRLGSCAAFGLLTPGAKMIWQFGEMGYETSIDDGGRTGEKAPHWEYLDNSWRKLLHDNYSQIIWLRRDYPELFSADASCTMKTADSDWATGRFITLRSSDRSKHLVAAFNPESSTKVLNYTFDSTTEPMQAAAKNSDSATFDVAKGTITLPGHCFIVLTNFDATSGVESVVSDSPSVSIYPNPTTDLINVDGEVQAINVYSLAGSLVATAQGDNSIDVQHLTSGVYIVKVTTPSGTATEKIVKK